MFTGGYVTLSLGDINLFGEDEEGRIVRSSAPGQSILFKEM